MLNQYALLMRKLAALILLPALLAATAMATEGLGNTILTVAADRVDCVGAGPQSCLQVKRPGSERFELFYQHIEGFDHQPGYQYQIEVSISPVANPPADGSSLRYQLLRVISKTAISTLEDTLWVLQATVDGKPLPAEVRVTLELSDGRATGSGGCNRYSGGYSLDGDQLSINPGGVTMMACPEPRAGVEQQFFTSLGQVRGYQINDGVLLLNDGAGKALLHFNAEPPLALIGTKWQLRSYNNLRGGLVSSRNSGNITAHFDAGGKLSGSAGCNRYFGGFQLDGEHIKLSPLGSTRKLCQRPEGVMKDERAYLAALATVSNYQIREQKLLLLNENGKRMLVFTLAAN